MTDFETMCEILAEFWLSYRDTKELQDFVTYNDLGLPLAYFVHEEIVGLTPAAEAYINETFNFLVAALGLDDKLSYESLDDMLSQAGLSE